MQHLPSMKGSVKFKKMLPWQRTTNQKDQETLPHSLCLAMVLLFQKTNKHLCIVRAEDEEEETSLHEI